MIKIKFYFIYSPLGKSEDKYIENPAYKIHKEIDTVTQELEHALHDKDGILREDCMCAIFLDYDIFINDNTRNIMFSKIVDIVDKKNGQPPELEVSNYMILCNGETLVIEDFAKIRNKLNNLISYGIDKLKKEREQNPEGILNSLRNKEADLKNPVDSMKASVKTANILYYLDDFIKEHEKDLESKMISCMINNPELNNDNPKTELELLNIEIFNILKTEEERNSVEFLKAEYNGKEISQQDILYELSTHYFPDYITQKNIMDTLSDDYKIETNTLLITREKGGDLRIVRKD